MKIIRLILTSIVLTSCARTSNTDYFVSDSATQEIEVSDIKEVEITCYCSGRVETRRTNSSLLSLTVTANSSSVGYHGKQEKPKNINPQILKFSPKRVGEKLVLSSRESAYIHHASIIESLIVEMPYNIKFNIQLIDGADLEGRRVE